MTIDISHLYTYRGIIDNVVDGDTVDIVVDLGFNVRIKERFRLLSSTSGVNTPEMHDKDPAVREQASKAKLRTIQLVTIGGEVLINTQKDKQDGFRRYLAQIINSVGVNVGDQLLVEHLGEVWVKS